VNRNSAIDVPFSQPGEAAFLSRPVRRRESSKKAQENEPQPVMASTRGFALSTPVIIPVIKHRAGQNACSPKPVYLFLWCHLRYPFTAVRQAKILGTGYCSIL
jgi:hypothetical protein